MVVRIVGASGRLGKVIASTLRGYDIVSGDVPLNYLVFSQRYRGSISYENEMHANLELVWKTIESTQWLEGDCSSVIIGSICSKDPAMHESLSYNLSKSSLPQVARYYAKLGPMRVNVVSPAGFRGDGKINSQQVADVVSFLCSPQSSGINGQEIMVTG